MPKVVSVKHFMPVTTNTLFHMDIILQFSYDIPFMDVLDKALIDWGFNVDLNKLSVISRGHITTASEYTHGFSGFLTPVLHTTVFQTDCFST